jgi:large subunit ribosomal protein L32
MGNIVPQRRISKTRKRLRRTHFKLSLPGMSVCPNCNEEQLSHSVCKNCGFYDGAKFKKSQIERQEEIDAKREKEENK